MAAFKLPIQLTINYVEWLWSNGGLTVLLDDEVYSMHETSLHQCNMCGEEFLAIPVVLKRKYKEGDNGCRKCNPHTGGRNAWTEERYVSKLRDKVGETVSLLGNYSNQSTNTLHRCNICSHEWNPLPGLLLAGYGCPVCGQRKSHISATKFKSICLDGKEFSKLQGYEPQALQWIVQNKNIHVDDIVTAHSGAPYLEYVDFDGVSRKHYPDIFVKSKNLLVEVKSSYTFKKALKRNQCKCRAAHQLGFKYVVLVLDRSGNPLKLPKGWEQYSEKQLIKGVPWLRN